MKDNRAGAPLWRWSVLFCALVITSPAIFAQNEADPNNHIEILKLHWEKQVRLPRNFDPSVISTGVPFNDPTARTSPSGPMTATDAARAATRAQNAAAGASTAFPATPTRLPVFYAYSMKIKNDAAKTIEAVAWDYVFIDGTNGTEVSRHQFLSYEKVASGKTVTFKSQLRSPPTRIVQVADTHQQHSKLLEHAVVQCVLYADQTAWRNTQAAPDICKLLANARPLKRKEPSRQN
jgi:hypothetical protein